MPRSLDYIALKENQKIERFAIQSRHSNEFGLTTYLCQMSTNVQRETRQTTSFKDRSPNRSKTKLRRLPMMVARPSGVDVRGDAILDTLTKAISDPDNSHKSPGGLQHMPTARREIRIGLLEIVDARNEAEASHSLLDGTFETRCTLEIATAKYQEIQGGMKVASGDDLWRDQQIGNIRTSCDDYGHSTTHVKLPKPFIISADELLVKKRSSVGHITPRQHFKFALADQYVVKIWLEAPNLKSSWPPVEVQSSLDPNGGMARGLRDGTFTSTDIRLMCKGVLFSEGVHSSYDMVLKLGGLRIHSNYTLRLDIQYSLLPQFRLPQKAPDTCHTQTSVETRVETEIRNSHSIESHSLFNLEAAETKSEDFVSSSKPCRLPLRTPCLAISTTKRRLCGAVIKDVLFPGEELSAIDDNLENTWRTAKHVSLIQGRPDIRNDAKDYILKWDSFMTPLRLSSRCFVPQALIKFVKENIDWFAERKARITEFSLHATTLRLRGIINVECFANCLNLLRDCIAIHGKERTSQEIDMLGADGATDTVDPTGKNIVDIVGNKKRIWEARTVNGKVAHEDAWMKATTDMESSLGGHIYAEPVLEVSLNGTIGNEDGLYQNASNQNQVLGDAMDKDDTRDLPQLTTEKDATKEIPDDDLIFEDASEELEILDIDDYFDAESGAAVLHQPPYLQSYWQSLTQRWPRLKLHPREHFGIASVIAAIAIFQGFPRDNIDRLIALHIHHCPNENIRDLVTMYHGATDIAPVAPGVVMTQRRLHRVMWEAGRAACEAWLMDVYRVEGGARRSVRDAVEIAASKEMWDGLWACIADECGGGGGGGGEG